MSLRFVGRLGCAGLVLQIVKNALKAFDLKADLALLAPVGVAGGLIKEAADFIGIGGVVLVFASQWISRPVAA